MRIAMWSGPRNISTAMMRAWENRKDTQVVDEPFYAYYLKYGGVKHPMQEEVLASQNNEWTDVIIDPLSEPLSTATNQSSIQYQKHMTQHMIMDVSDPVFINWFKSLRHVFLVRHPAFVVSSYVQKRESVTASDIGFEQQHTLFQLAKKLGFEPLVIESEAVLKNPHAVLSDLCERLSIPFQDEMLNWPSGRRESDGVWASHWYQNVEKSTGFQPYQEKKVNLNPELQTVVNECLPHYQAMLGAAL